LGSTCFFHTETSEDVLAPYQTKDDTDLNYTYEKLLEPSVKDSL
jgi:hypothetical protein